MKEHDFIDQMVEDLQPRSKVFSPNRVFLIWTVLNFTFVFLSMYASGSMRQGWSDDLLYNWQFQVEFFLGMTVSTISGFFLFHLAIPGDPQAQGFRRWIPVLILALFSTVLIASVFFPAMEVTYTGYRVFCMHQLLGFSIPPLLVLLYHLKKTAPINLYYVGFLAGIAAAAPFATAMHLACAYDPRHILIFHILPVIAVSLLAAAISHFLIRWWK